MKNPFLSECAGKVYFSLDKFKNGVKSTNGMCDPDKKPSDLKAMQRDYAMQFETLRPFYGNSPKLAWYKEARDSYLEREYVPVTVLAWVRNWKRTKQVPTAHNPAGWMPTNAYQLPEQDVVKQDGMRPVLEFARFLDNINEQAHVK